MAKETAPPKAVNIIRPTHSFTPTNKASSRVSSSSSSIVSHSSFISAPPTLARKPVRVASGARILQDKPALNIYHPPSPPQKKSTSASRLPLLHHRHLLVLILRYINHPVVPNLLRESYQQHTIATSIHHNNVLNHNELVLCLVPFLDPKKSYVL